jgi:hypothetical protein
MLEKNIEPISNVAAIMRYVWNLLNIMADVCIVLTKLAKKSYI